MDGNKLRQIIDRIERLEKAIFISKRKTAPTIQAKDFGGLKGGLHLLISRGFFKTKKTLSDTKQELEKHGYHYSAPAVQTTLNRLSRRTGPLTTFREGGKKVYIKRK